MLTNENYFSKENQMKYMGVSQFKAFEKCPAAAYAENWIVGCNPDLLKTLDLRILPCCYVLDGAHTIVNKSLSVEGLISAVKPNY